MAPNRAVTGSRLRWRWLGQLSHADAYQAQMATAHAVHARRCDGEILLCEHPAVITLGRAANRANILWSNADLTARGIDVVTTERGGDVTYHGPGQLLIYPVVPLVSTLSTFLRTVADAVAAYAQTLGVTGLTFQQDPAGLWAGDAKVMACGLHLWHRIVTHGFALDLATPPDAWRVVRPCGLAAPNASLASLMPADAGAAPTAEAAATWLGPTLTARLDRFEEEPIEK